ncbi:MAG TPA: hypothetical protein VH539_19100 [Gemmatimonadaceae bacterium]|jgi:hypothetical protein
MRRNTLLLLVGAVAALAVACQDAAVVAPGRNLDPLSASPHSPSGIQNRTTLGTLELSPNGGIYHVGDFDIVVPAGAVCNPATAKYGAKHWDDDCAPMMSTMVVQVVTKTSAAGVSVDFQPDLRFRPNAGWVTIQTHAYSPLLSSTSVRQLARSSLYFQNFVILYSPSDGSSRIDEVRTTGDPSMMTHIDLKTGIVWRRVKHFSGYLVTAGFNCTPSASAAGCPVDDPTQPIQAPLPSGSLVGTVVVADSTVAAAPSVVVDP